MLFNCERSVSGLCVVRCEAFCEDVSALVMLVFEATFPEDFVDVFNFYDLGFVRSKVIPYWIVFRRPGVDPDDFPNEGFPSIGPVVHPVIEGFVTV